MNGLAITSAVLTCLVLLATLRLRRRAAALPVLPASAEPVADQHTFIVRDGVGLSDATRRSASAYARTHGLQVLDLVAPDLCAWRSQLLLDTTDPTSYRGERFARGVTAGDALLVDREVARRAGVPREAHSALELLQIARCLKRHAATSTDLVIAPGLTSPGLPLRERRRLLRIHFGALVVPLNLAAILFLAFCVASAPVWGSALLVTLHLQYVLVTLGTPLRPRDRWRAAGLRLFIDLASLLGPAAALPDKRASDAQLRASYAQWLAGGTQRFFEPRRHDCPLCSSQQLQPHLRARDRLLLKPGEARLERCAECGHIFQNPRLSLEGLEFYYRDCYDGVGEEQVDMLFAAQHAQYQQRVDLVRSIQGAPRRWLDVGAGHGHFCCAASAVLPETRFEGLDLSESIDEAERRGWVDRGIRGLFPECASLLAAEATQYDVVSMSHYLEHVLEPRAELEAAARVLPEGGLLFIEVPDPESRLGRILGSYWAPWFQPQHLNFLTVRNLERLLRDVGFEPVCWQRGEAHIPVDFTAVAYFLIGRIAPRVDLPWVATRGLVHRIWRALTWVFMAPVFALGMLLDKLLAPLLRRPGWSNTFRVVARRLESPAAAPLGSSVARAEQSVVLAVGPG